MQAQNLRDSTRAAMQLFGSLLAKDMDDIPDGTWVELAREVLQCLDKLDVVGDEGTDRRLEEVAQAHGSVWVELAEEGALDGTDHVGHVLYHFDAGGYPGGAFERNLLTTIDSADERNRWALAIGLPELVGLWRAVAETPDGKARLVAVLDRK